MIISAIIPKRIITISESQYSAIRENVYVSSLNNKKKQAYLTYDRYGSRNKGNINAADNVKTDKMNVRNGDTYEVPLKGGIMSYNITSINGTDVMHYFKRHFEKNGQKTDMTINNEKYELMLKDEEFMRFIEDFKAKVKAVIDSKISDFKTVGENGFSGISIYPVPSSSNFNVEMAKILATIGFNGMSVRIMNTAVLRKDTSNIQKDEEFMEKNKDYYDSAYSNEKNVTHNQVINTDLEKLKKHSSVYGKIDGLNMIAKKLLIAYNNRNKNGITPSQIERIGKLYSQYTQSINDIVSSTSYYSEKDDKVLGRNSNKVIKPISYSKGPSIETRSNAIRRIALKSGSFDRKWYTKKYDVCLWEPVDFEIKKLGNDTRMALKNYYQPNNNDLDMVRQEVEKALNTIVVIFDDNVSGGATLSDICMQLKSLKINNIIPITFGEMHQQWRVGTTNIKKPEGGFKMNEAKNEKRLS